jgi:hypothetical protein
MLRAITRLRSLRIAPVVRAWIVSEGDVPRASGDFRWYRPVNGPVAIEYARDPSA